MNTSSKPTNAPTTERIRSGQLPAVDLPQIKGTILFEAIK
jgi:hypothetical protein